MESFLPRFADGKDALENVLKKDALPVTSTSPLLKNKFVKDSWHSPGATSQSCAPDPNRNQPEPNPQELNPVSQAYVTVACGQLTAPSTPPPAWLPQNKRKLFQPLLAERCNKWKRLGRNSQILRSLGGKGPLRRSKSFVSHKTS